MAVGLLGRKLGMTQVFDKEGRRLPVTVIEAGPCRVVQVKEQGRHGYRAVQLGYEPVAPRRLTKPQRGHLERCGAPPLRYLREIRLEHPEESYTVGQDITVQVFQPGDYVDVTGISIGKGFQGGVRRWGWRGGPASHGSMRHRDVGSIGASAYPSRVVRGHHLPGHMGHDRVTVQNLRVVEVHPEQGVLVVRGAVPGVEGGLLVIRKAIKRPGRHLPAQADAPEAASDATDEAGGGRSEGA